MDRLQSEPASFDIRSDTKHSDEAVPAYVQALQEAKRAQARAYQERKRLQKAGKPYEHIVAPRVEHFIALQRAASMVDSGTCRNVPVVRASASRKDRGSFDTSTQLDTIPEGLEFQEDNDDNNNYHQPSPSPSRQDPPTLSISPQTEDEPFPPSHQPNDDDDDYHSDTSTISLPPPSFSVFHGSSQLVDVHGEFERHRELYVRLSGLSPEDLLGPDCGKKRKRLDEPEEAERHRKKKRRENDVAMEWETTQNDKQQHYVNRRLPTPTPSQSPTDNWPSHFASVALLPTPSPSLTTAPPKHAVLEDAFSLRSTLGAIKSELERAQEWFDRLSANLAKMGLDTGQYS